ncbi:MAG: TetR/AcrR family transcriptional regulator [Rhodospirillales bacterium]|nr:TetR/AcrR family transcriptional regulator [Rhodospirillales bacterium]
MVTGIQSQAKMPGGKPTNEVRRTRRGRPSLAEVASRRESTQERLLKSAIDAFAKHGFDAVTTSLIAENAGMAQSMVHYHFKSKEQIWKAAIEQLMRELSERFPLAKDELKDLDPASRLKVLVRRFVKMSARDISLSRIMIHEGTARGPRLNWIAENFLKPGFEPLDQTVKEGVDAGLLKDLPVYTVTHTIISAAAMTYCLAPVVDATHNVDLAQSASMDEMADTVLTILFDGLLARPDDDGADQ